MVEWALADVKRAAELGLPRLAFVGLAAWAETLTLLHTGGKHKGKGAWRSFARKYLAKVRSDADADVLYVGMRCALSHEYGTRDVALTDGHPEQHRQVIGGLLMLNLESLIEEFEQAFDTFYDDLLRDAELRRVVLPKTKGLLAPVSASVASLPLLLNQLTIQASASATVAAPWTPDPPT